MTASHRRHVRAAAIAASVALFTGACLGSDGSGVPTSVASGIGDGTGARAEGAGGGDPDAPPGTAAAEGIERVFVRLEFAPIDDAQLTALRAVDGVASVSALRADDVALFGSSRRDGTPVDDLPADFKIPVGGLVDDGQVGLGLERGEVAITATGLAFRDLDVGGRVVLADGLTATVARIVDDPRFQRHELVLSTEDAATLGVRARQRASLVLAADAVVADVVDAASSILGADGLVQPRPAGDARLVLSLAETKGWFGEFAFQDLPGRDITQGASFVREHIIQRDVPFFGVITCHEDIFEPLVGALQQIRDEGLGDEIVPSQYAGCWTPRRINRNANLSRHAWGIAIDINVDIDAPGLGPVPSPGVIAAFEQHGFRWGGDYPVPDNHHFEYHGGGS